MKTTSLKEAIELERNMRIESRAREEMYMSELAKKNPFKIAALETDIDGVDFTIGNAVMHNKGFLAHGYDTRGNYREKSVSFCDVG